MSRTAPVVVSLALFAIIAAGFAQSAPPAPLPKEAQAKADKVSEFMREKLSASQSVLEGLVTEDFDKVAEGAQKMLVMSRATEWHVIEGPVYLQYSNEFRRSCEQLAKMAKDENIDGASLSYMHLTLTCISCHKYVKGTQIAENSLPLNQQQLQAALTPKPARPERETSR